MPQLSPLNWIFLFMLFWGCIFLMFAMLWWGSKLEFSASPAKETKSTMKVQENSWSW